jgi:integrase/recombinase XerD
VQGRRVYLELPGHRGRYRRTLVLAAETERPARRLMDPDAIDHVVRKYAGELGLDRCYSAHSMRATLITTALENGARLEDVQKAAGHCDPGTTE